MLSPTSLHGVLRSAKRCLISACTRRWRRRVCQVDRSGPVLRSPRSIEQVHLPGKRRPAKSSRTHRRSSYASRRKSSVQGTHTSSLPQDTSVSPIEVVPVGFIVATRSTSPRRSQVALSNGQFERVSVMLVSSFRCFTNEATLRRRLLRALETLRRTKQCDPQCTTGHSR